MPSPPSSAAESFFVWITRNFKDLGLSTCGLMDKAARYISLGVERSGDAHYSQGDGDFESFCYSHDPASSREKGGTGELCLEDSELEPVACSAPD